MKKRILSLSLACMMLAALLLPTLAFAAPAEVEGLSAAQSQIGLVAGETAKLEIKVSPSRYRNAPLSYSSSKASVATVDDKGTVTAVKKGTATIAIAAENGVKTTVAVRVVAKGEPTGITLNHTSLELAVKGTGQLIPTLAPKEGITKKNQTVTYKSNNSKVVKVDKAGNLTGVKAGTATITAKTKNGFTATCKVTVSNITIVPTKLVISPAALSLPAGESEQLQATFTPANTTERVLTYVSSNTSIATVDKGGKVTGVAPGRATITVTTANNKTARCNVTVTAGKAGGVTSITPDSKELSVLVGKTTTLTYTMLPANATDKSVAFTSSNKTVATVDSKGVIKGIKAGSATITITAKNGVSAKVVVAVSKDEGIPVTALRLSTTRLELSIRETATITAQVQPKNASDSSVTFISRDGSVASVDKNGKVTALRAGETTIDVYTSNNLKETCVVIVKAAESVPVSRIQLNYTSRTMKPDDSFNIGAQALPANAADLSLTFESSNPAVASVNRNGQVTALAAGKATITVTAASGVTAGCSVVVEEATKAPEEQPAGNDYASQVLYYVNLEREKAGLAPLKLHSGLNRAAQTRANEIITLFAHTRPDGRHLSTIFTEEGITYSTAGENIAAGLRTPQAVVEGWMNSSGHRANILSSRYTHMGLGYTTANDRYGHYWAQLFLG